MLCLKLSNSQIALTSRECAGASGLSGRIVDLTESALFVWFSSTSAEDARGSTLVYVVNERVTIPWFASMTCASSTWSSSDVEDLGREEVRELPQHPSGVRP